MPKRVPDEKSRIHENFTYHHPQFSRHVPAPFAKFTIVKGGAILPLLNLGGPEMNSTERLTNGSPVTDFPPLRRPQPETADRGTLRLGDACLTAAFPPLRQPKPETADRGTLRLGDACLTAAFPPLRRSPR
jgi:hypothetical protein